MVLKPKMTAAVPFGVSKVITLKKMTEIVVIFLKQVTFISVIILLLLTEMVSINMIWYQYGINQYDQWYLLGV